MRGLLILLGALLWAAPAVASELDLSFNGDAFRLRFARPFEGSQLAWDAGWLHHADNGDALHGGLYLSGLASEGGNPLQGGLGIRGVFANGDLDDQDGLIFALGGFLRYTLPRYNRFSIAGSVYYGPQVLGIGEVEKLEDYELRAAYNLLRNADAYIGVRYVKAEYDQAPRAYFDTGLHVGVNLRF